MSFSISFLGGTIFPLCSWCRRIAPRLNSAVSKWVVELLGIRPVGTRLGMRCTQRRRVMPALGSAHLLYRWMASSMTRANSLQKANRLRGMPVYSSRISTIVDLITSSSFLLGLVPNHEPFGCSGWRARLPRETRWF